MIECVFGYQGMSVTDVDGTLAKLKELGIQFERFDHEAVPTVEVPYID